MSFNFPEGASQQFSQTLAAEKTITILTNANPAVATSVGHGYVDNDEILLISGWEDATESVYKVNQLTADTFEILGLDTSNTSFFPAGSGLGTAQKISNWLAIPQVLTISANGGDPRFTDIQLLSRRNAVKVPTGFNAVGVTLSLAHDEGQANYQTMKGISRNLSKCCFKQVLSGGSVTYGYGYMAVGEFPKLNSNQVNTVDCAMTLLGRAVSYA
jgi:hypothetical protein